MTESDVRRIEDAVVGVRLELAEMRGELKPTFEKLVAKEDEQDDQIKDHEVRLRALEKFRFSIPNVSGLIALTVAAIEGVYYFTHIHH